MDLRRSRPGRHRGPGRRTRRPTTSSWRGFRAAAALDDHQPTDHGHASPIHGMSTEEWPTTARPSRTSRRAATWRSARTSTNSSMSPPGPVPGTWARARPRSSASATPSPANSTSACTPPRPCPGRTEWDEQDPSAGSYRPRCPTRRPSQRGGARPPTRGTRTPDGMTRLRDLDSEDGTLTPLCRPTPATGPRAEPVDRHTVASGLGGGEFPGPAPEVTASAAPPRARGGC